MLRWGAAIARIGVCAGGRARKWTKWTVCYRRKRGARGARRAAAGRRADGSWRGCSRWGACRTGRWGCALRGSFCPDHSSPRHPGLGSGTTGPQGNDKRLRPSPSPQGGPRNESGVTGLFGLGSGRHFATVRRRLGPVCGLCPPHTGPASGFCYMHCRRRTHPVTPDLVRGPPGREGAARGSGHPPRRRVDPGTSPG